MDGTVMASWNELIDTLYDLRRVGIKPGLRRMRRALAREGHPDHKFDVITVAGTNGKGTVASLVAAILQAHGARVGLYTSPHLMDIRERFRVDGGLLDRDDVADVLGDLLDSYTGEPTDGAVELTFFEITTLAAASLFCAHEVDYAVFEVGLGGRLDAVNAMEPAISAITTIGRDHTRYLGDDLDEIAREKAGVFRGGIPAVVGEQESSMAHRALVDKAGATGAEVYDLNEGEKHPSSPKDIVERHRRTARQVAALVLGESMQEQNVERGMQKWRWPGRFDEVALEGGQRRMIVDAAHNAPGLEALKSFVLGFDGEIAAVIWASMEDKEPGPVASFFEALEAPVWGSEVANKRARSGDQLRRYVPKPLWQGASTTRRVVQRARAETDGDILVFGSVFLVGEVFATLDRPAEALRTYAVD